jgi:hypothetical protein
MTAVGKYHPFHPKVCEPIHREEGWLLLQVFLTNQCEFLFVHLMDEEVGHFVAADSHWPRDALKELDEYSLCMLSVLEIQN